MADFTTTTNLSLKKPAIGGSSDKWGEYLNENMETIGTSIVDLQNASTSRSLESLSNVLDTTPTTGQLLQYDTASWKAATVTIPDNIQDLTNVTILSPSDGQVLAWSNSNSRWENQTPGAATIPDGTITTAKLSTSLQGQVALILQTTGAPTDNQILRYDSTSTNWQFEDLPGGTVSALSDTDVSAIANKDVLVYNSTSGNWVSRPLVISDITNLQTSLDAKLESSDITVSALSDTTITTTADDSFLVYDSSDSKWKNEGPSTVRSTLSLVVGTNVQAFDQGLQSIAGLTTVANKMLYTTASDTYGVADLTAAGRAILDDADAAAQRTTLGLGFFATRSIVLDLTVIGGFPPTAEFIRYVTYNDDQVLFNKIDLNDQYNFENSLAVSLGGTGATTASAARTNLGLGALATQDTITESQISDLGSYITASSTDTLTNKSGNISQWINDSGYLTAETNDLSSSVTWANVPDANITQSSVTQHQAALSITESQISDLQTYLTAETNDLGTAVTGTLGIGNGGTGLTAIGTAGQVLAVNAGATALEYQTISGSGTVTSVAVSGSDGIEVDSGSPITSSGTIALGINATSLSTHLGLGTAATTASTDYATAVQGATADSALQDVVSDTTPQLGGNLDVNGNSIVSVSAGNISITPDTTGKIVLDGLSWPTADGIADQVLQTDGAGNLSFVDVQQYDADTTKNDVANTFTANQIISVTDNTNAALRITQTGTGNALVVEDSTNPDSSSFVVDASGNVGIGTSPASNLHVASTSGETIIKATASDTGTSRVFLDLSGYRTSADQGIIGGVNFTNQNTTNTTIASIQAYKEGSSAIDLGYLSFYTKPTGGSLTERIRIFSNGAVLINYLGTGPVYSNSGFLTNTDPSDLNLKENIVEVGYGLSEVKQLRPVEFDWIADEADKHELGFIAQEVQLIIPDLVNTYERINEETGETEIGYGLESTQFIPVLVKAVQEQQTLIESQQSQIDALTARIEALEDN